VFEGPLLSAELVRRYKNFCLVIQRTLTLTENVLGSTFISFISASFTQTCFTAVNM